MYIVKISNKVFEFKDCDAACRAALGDIWYRNFHYRFEKDPNDPSCETISDDYVFVWKRYFEAFKREVTESIENSHSFQKDHISITFVANQE